MELITIIHLHESHSYYSGDNETFTTRHIFYINKNDIAPKLQELVRNNIFHIYLDNFDLTLPLYGLMEEKKEILKKRTEIENLVQSLVDKIDNKMITEYTCKQEEDIIIGTMIIDTSACDDGFSIEYILNYKET